MDNLSAQQWTCGRSQLSGARVAYALVWHLLGASSFDEELTKAQERVRECKVTDTLTDAHGTVYTRMK